MSQRRNSKNPSFGRKANVPNPATNIFNPIADTPNSTTLTLATSTPLTNLQTSLAIAITHGSSSLETTPLETILKENFGRDKDLKNLLKHL